MNGRTNLRSVRDPLFARRLSRVWGRIEARLDALEAQRIPSAPELGADRAGGPGKDEPAREPAPPIARQPGGAAATPSIEPARSVPAHPIPEPPPRPEITGEEPGRPNSPARLSMSATQRRAESEKQASDRQVGASPAVAPRRKLIDLNAAPSSMEQHADRWAGR